MSKNNDSRRDEIKKYILTKEKVRVEELASMLNVSLETIRSDLSFLENTGLLYRTHGGATLRNAIVDLPMDIRIKEKAEEKKQIAYKAINFINDDDVIYIDPSSTALPLGRLLRLKKNLTIVTNSFELIPIIAESDHKLIIVGGDYLKAGKRMVGGYATDVIRTIHYDLAIFGMDGCKEINGPGIMGREEIFLNSEVMKRTSKSMILSDSSKFDKIGKYQYTTFEEIDIFITDVLSDEDRKRVNAKTVVEAMKK